MGICRVSYLKFCVNESLDMFDMNTENFCTASLDCAWAFFFVPFRLKKFFHSITTTGGRLRLKVNFFTTRANVSIYKNIHTTRFDLNKKYFLAVDCSSQENYDSIEKRRSAYFLWNAYQFEIVFIHNTLSNDDQSHLLL